MLLGEGLEVDPLSQDDTHKQGEYRREHDKWFLED